MKTFTSITKVGYRSWVYTWTGTGPFRVIANGREVETNYARTTYQVFGADDEEPPMLEVVDMGDPATVDTFLWLVTIQWFGDPSAFAYQVLGTGEGLFEEPPTIPEDGSGYYSFSYWESDDDCTVDGLTVCPMDISGNLGGALSFEFTMIHHPAAPLVDYAYEASTGTFTVSERTP